MKEADQPEKTVHEEKVRLLKKASAAGVADREPTGQRGVDMSTIPSAVPEGSFGTCASTNRFLILDDHQGIFPIEQFGQKSQSQTGGIGGSPRRNFTLRPRGTLA